MQSWKDVLTVKVKVKLSLIMHWGHMGILEVQDQFCHGTRSMWVDSIMLWLLYSWRNLLWFPLNKGSRASLDHLENCYTHSRNEAMCPRSSCQSRANNCYTFIHNTDELFLNFCIYADCMFSSNLTLPWITRVKRFVLSQHTSYTCIWLFNTSVSCFSIL